jgi:hypothetical protein
MRNSVTIVSLILLLGLAGCNNEEGLNNVSPNNYIKILEGNSADDPIAIRLLADGNMLVVSNSLSFVQGEQIRKIRILKLNLEGNVLEEKAIPTSNEVNWSARDVISLENGEVLITATIQNGIGQDSSLLFYQIDQQLDSVRSSTYENEATYTLYGVHESGSELLFTAQESKSANSYPIIGRLNAADLSTLEVGRAEKYDVAPATKAYRNQSGEYIWAYNRSKSYLARVQSNLLQVNDEEISIRNSNEIKAEQLLMNENRPIVYGEIRIDDRNQLFYYDQSSRSSIIFGAEGNTQLNKVQKTEDGYLVTGFQELTIAGSESRRKNFFLSRRNNEGREIFTKAFGSNEDEELNDAILINNGIYSIGKTIFGGENTLLLIKTDALGQLKN